MNPQTKNSTVGAALPGSFFHFHEAEEAEKPAAVNGIRLTDGTLAVIHTRKEADTIRSPAPDLSVPPRGGEPRRIGEVMQPIQRIIAHPDRNRLMAEFCKRHW